MNAILPAASPRTLHRVPVRVLMVDDSAVSRSVIGRIIDDAADVNLVSRVSSPDEAFAFLAEQRVDIILLDHEMPGRKGLDALPALLDAAHDAHVIMLSSHCQRGSKTAVAALSIGASDALAKPSAMDSGPEFAEQLLSRIRRLASARCQNSAEADRLILRPFPEGFAVHCIGIGASTGGIHALAELLSAVSARPGSPVLITQHLPAAFISHYAKQVARMTDMPVSIARDGEVLRDDHVYIAPGEASLSCIRDGAKVRARLIAERDMLSSARPSVNPMFAGMAQSYGAGSLGIILTGIGRDGTAGASAVVKAGGAVIVQDETSSTVWGMPGSAARAGLVSACLAPHEMPHYLRAHFGLG
ncbi:response regulator [Sphingobium sp. DEHP117]|uniref:chemotaxis protein CheB n=1 Tax=Sphingobium sp. DEHP117 TaxID=2993436 RepID=UPI0027D4A8ED|nr:chemotaxis protein CheB [Sphingobium sp. DEHP117]MDQ4419904.1 response regulator [Sphingobium sp. DEHP117]